MPLSALVSLVVAGAMHAAWNLLVKWARQRQIFTWLSLVAGVICFLPLLVFGAAPVSLSAWPFVIASGIVEALYFFALTRAYGLGAFSLVYPLARGAAPCGARRAGSPARLAHRLRWPARCASAPVRTHTALLVACCVSVYSAIDGATVQTPPPIPYTVAVLGFSALRCAPFAAWHDRRAPIAAEWRCNQPCIVVVGAPNLATYMLVLTAYSRAPIAYAGAICEVGILFVALVGWGWLGEACGWARTRGAALIVVGAVVIAAFGWGMTRDRRFAILSVASRRAPFACRARFHVSEPRWIAAAGPRGYGTPTQSEKEGDRRWRRWN